MKRQDFRRFLTPSQCQKWHVVQGMGIERDLDGRREMREGGGGDEEGEGDTHVSGKSKET